MPLLDTPVRLGVQIQPQHVTYPQIAPEPAGYSPRWIGDILRTQMGFRGVVFSDDIGMAAALSVGGVKARIDAHLDAGCDVVLVCHPQQVDEALVAIEGRTLNTMALINLIGRGPMAWDGLLADARREAAQAQLATLRTPQLNTDVLSGAIHVGDTA